MYSNMSDVAMYAEGQSKGLGCRRPDHGYLWIWAINNVVFSKGREALLITLRLVTR